MGMLISIQQIYIPKFIIQMKCMRELPQEYLELCPVIDQKYRVVFKLGCGRFSKVKMGIDTQTNQRVAIKILNERVGEEWGRGEGQEVIKGFLNEVRTSHESKHRHIVQIVDFNVGGAYRSADGRLQRILYYVMKIQQYGQLYRLISHTEQFSEKTARTIFRQLLSALRHLHSRHIAHCDIKSENILLDSKFNLKLVDFGSARHTTDELNQPITYQVSDAVGSVKCNAPEITNKQGEYSPEAIDIFAAGCFLFELVMKAEPFKSSHMQDQHYSKLADLDHNKFWDIFSSKAAPSLDFKDLIQKMLNPNPKERISLPDLLKHPWVNGDSLTRQEYRKEMNTRVKKVMVKVRKQQENQIKQSFLKQKGKKEPFTAEHYPLTIPRQYEEQIYLLKNMIAIDDRSSSSHEDCSSHEENQREEVKGKEKRLGKKVSEEGARSEPRGL